MQRDFVDRYWRDDNLQEEYIDEFLISVGGPEDETSSDNSDSDSVSDSSESD